MLPLLLLTAATIDTHFDSIQSCGLKRDSREKKGQSKSETKRVESEREREREREKERERKR